MYLQSFTHIYERHTPTYVLSGLLLNLKTGYKLNIKYTISGIFKSESKYAITKNEDTVWLKERPIAISNQLISPVVQASEIK